MLINCYHGFSRLGLEKILSQFLEHSEEYVSVSASFQNIMLQELTPVYVKTTRSIFVECFSEETQIIDIFTHYKLPPHKISQYTLATRLSSCQRWGNPLCQSVWKTMETVDWHPWKLRFKQTEKNPSRAFVSGNHCKGVELTVINRVKFWEVNLFIQMYKLI